MTEPNISPQVGEIWELTNCNFDWGNVVVLEIADKGKSFIAARISITDLSVNYSGLNVEIIDSFLTNVPSNFVIHIEKADKVSKDKFSKKRGTLNDADLQKVLNNYRKHKNKKDMER